MKQLKTKSSDYNLTIMNYYWKKPFLSSTYTIYSGDKLVGKLRENSWTNSAEGELYGEKFSFKTNGIFNQITSILSQANNEVIGSITYNTFRTSAQILNQHQVLNWKNLNWGHSKWQLTENSASMINYSGSSFKGEIDSDTEDPLLILSGLFIANYFWQSLVAIFMVLFIIFVAVN